MQRLSTLDLALQRLDQRLRQHRASILATLAIATAGGKKGGYLSAQP
jgi:hypothetical protein